MPPSFSASSFVAMTLGALVTVFVRLHKLGVCTMADGGVKLASNPDTVRAPDFAFFSKERLPTGVPPRGYLGPPDLAVEVVSVTDRLTDVVKKAKEYLGAGTRLVWVIEPATRAALVFHPGREPDHVEGDATLEGEDVLPGFSLPLSELWQGLAEEGEPSQN